jgi:uncharacterized protein
MVIPTALMREILVRHPLPWDGLHGLPHWGRVLENGLKLATRTGADTELIALFAVFHDCQRINEGIDPGHGRRGADLAGTLRGSLLHIDSTKFELLYYACAHHTDGYTEADVSVQTCWDADRLDLGRVAIQPTPNRLCTEAGKSPKMIAFGNRRSREGVVPAIVAAEWLPIIGSL